MPKKRASSKDAGSAKPKQLRKRLRKAEDQLQDAQTKRDRAQARVEALSIIADEIRAQLAELDKREQAEPAKAQPDAAPASVTRTTKQKAGTNKQAPAAGQAPATRVKAAGRKRATATTPVAAKKAVTGKDGATRKPAVAKKTAAAASPSATATARKTAGSTARKSGNGPGPTSS